MKRRYFLAGILTVPLLILSHGVWLGHGGARVFYLHLFIIILTFCYLFNLKLTSYLADFKTLKNQSRLDICFLTIFFALLFIPMSHISKDKISQDENRTLAVWHSLIDIDGKLNFNFGKDFDNWFNDRFAMRKTLMDIGSLPLILNFDVINAPRAIYNSKTHRMFTKTELQYVIKTDKKDFIIKSLDALEDFCNKNKISLYVLIVPYNADIYAEDDIPTFFERKQKVTNNQIVNEVVNKTKSKAIYAYDELKKASKDNYVYFKTDHHWTDYGAYLGYKILLKEIQKDYPKIKPVSLDDYDTFTSKLVRADNDRKLHAGQTIHSLPSIFSALRYQILDTEFTYYDHKDRESLDLEIVNVPYHRQKISHYPKGANLRVVELGTSMNENLLGFTQYTFKDVKYIRTNNIKNLSESEQNKIMKYHKEEILNFNPDILIVCVTPINLKYLNFFEEGE